VVAEIDDASSLSMDALAERASYLEASGASVISLGVGLGVDRPGAVEDMVSCVRGAVGLPVSVDCGNEREILAAADAGADLILSVDESTIHLLDLFDVPVVCIPRDAGGRVPPKPLERVKLAERLVERAYGRKVVVDMILSPVNFGYADSLCSYSLFRERNMGVPMMFGAGNVTELLDADSVGVNALLAGYASEVGAGLLFTVEASPKTRGLCGSL